ncbi:MAG: hypothetical protein J0I43_16195 [Microbacterium sp.]|uniref:hypothetical protein n=1 Tax=Microbacterium sp. TaxID=51671 RepID=UPI001AC0F35E|nr:hypothetical protein [Microbacterium sp.]MBN9178890.1 hypothetical protein [Microbacterium sp.]
MFVLGLVESALLWITGALGFGAYLGAVGVEAPIVLGALCVVLLLTKAVSSKISMRRSPKDVRRSYFATVGNMFSADVTNPSRGLFAFVGARKVIDGSRGRRAWSWTVVSVHFLWALALIVTLAVILASWL